VTVQVQGGSSIRFINEQESCLWPDCDADATLFPNYFIPPVVPRRLGRRVVVLHDLQYRHFPAYFSARKRLWLRAAHRLALVHSDLMVVISDFVRRDVIKWFGASAGRKLAVIPNAISWERFGAPGPIRPIERPYILAVAAHYPHKNLETLIRAFARLVVRDRDLQLVLCGQDFRNLHGVFGEGVDLNALVGELGIGHRVTTTGYIDDDELGLWYRHARGFAFPSVFEGFGMPAVEALGFGLPTITTRRTALPESTRGLAHYVDDPYNVEEWTSKLLALARAPEILKPKPGDVDDLRRYYDPVRIADLYRTVCFEAVE
jgi:glycosyltransferase involved in cell wall biosynthesis